MKTRLGDSIVINGGYQMRALESGFVVQRFWHWLKQDIIDRHCPVDAQDVVLDCGCGSGVVSDFLAKRARRVVAIDANPGAIEFAQQRFDAPNIQWHNVLSSDLKKIGEGPFDKIYCLELIEHIYLEQGRRLIQDFDALLRPDGVLFLTTPNYRSLWPMIEILMDQLRLTPKISGAQHVMKYTSKRLSQLIGSENFEPIYLGSCSTFAPFLSVLGWGIALKMHTLEQKWRWQGGNVLVQVWRKRK